jgi:pyridoxine kinase
VGNKAAVFPLQLLGFDVDVINSVQFSNHTGYPKGHRGDVLNGDQLRSLWQGLELNGLLDSIGHVLTGYMGSASMLQGVVDVVSNLQQRKSTTNASDSMPSSVRYVCDPVLGDQGIWYVPRALVDIYRQQVLPLADVVTPNQFEIEQLTGMSITCLDEAVEACALLHQLGPSLVMLTSVIFPADAEHAAATETDNESMHEKDTMTVLTSFLPPSSSTSSPPQQVVYQLKCPILPGQFTGTGDLCASLLLAQTALHPDDLPLALEHVVNTMAAILQRTHQASLQQQRGTNSESKVKDNGVQSRELQLIQSKADIENPPRRFRATRIR